MIFDGHVHLFHPKIISNVKKRGEMVDLFDICQEMAFKTCGLSVPPSDRSEKPELNSLVEFESKADLAALSSDLTRNFDDQILIAP